MNSTRPPMSRRTRGNKQRNHRITTEVVPDDALATIRAGSDVLRRRQREHQRLSLGDGGVSGGGSVRVRLEEVPQSSVRWLAQCGATLADLIRWLADMPSCDCASFDIISWPEAQAAVFDGTPFGARVGATRTALAELHASVVQPLIDAGRLTPPPAFTLERLIWARGKQLRTAPPAALSTSVRLWCGLPLVCDNPLDTYEVFVSTAFPLTSEAEASLLRVRLGHLDNGDGIAGVECEQISLEDGRPGARVRAGPFVLRRQNPTSGCVPPALLWCFACLAVEDQEEPAVTFDESDACIAFLKRALHGLSASAAPDAATIEAAQLPLSEDAPEATAQALQISVEERAAVGLALYRSGARAALKDAISATQAMVDDSAPLSEAHTAECRRVIKLAEAHAAAKPTGWSTTRHVAYPTTDLAVANVPTLVGWLPRAVDERLLPEFEQRFCLSPGKLRVDDMFVAKYEHSRPMPVAKDSTRHKGKSDKRRETGVAVAYRGITQGQAGLGEHEDGSAWSFVLPLNPPDEYEGGGTQFVNLDGKPLFRPAHEGIAVMFSGKNRHCGKAITAGVRYILAGFCSLVQVDGRPDNSHLSQLMRTRKRRRERRATKEKKKEQAAASGDESTISVQERR